MSLAVNSRQFKALLYLLAFIDLFVSIVSQSLEDDESESDGYQPPKASTKQFAHQRAMKKPWYTREIRINDDIHLPISPVSIVVFWLSICFLVYTLGGGGKPAPAVVASHILLKDHSDEAEEQLEKLKAEIGKDGIKFAKAAKQLSACPSKQNGGNLGRFKRHDMTPSFDQVCFDPKTPLETTVGPIQTQFGWHLIYIHDRKL